MILVSLAESENMSNLYVRVSNLYGSPVQSENFTVSRAKDSGSISLFMAAILGKECGVTGVTRTLKTGPEKLLLVMVSFDFCFLIDR